METDQPKIAALILDWQVFPLPDLSAVSIGFLVLPWKPGEASEEARMPLLGLNAENVRRLHANLGELVDLMDRSHGTPGTPQ